MLGLLLLAPWSSLCDCYITEAPKDISMLYAYTYLHIKSASILLVHATELLRWVSMHVDCVVWRDGLCCSILVLTWVWTYIAWQEPSTPASVCWRMSSRSSSWTARYLLRLTRMLRYVHNVVISWCRMWSKFLLVQNVKTSGVLARIISTRGSRSKLAVWIENNT